MPITQPKKSRYFRLLKIYSDVVSGLTLINISRFMYNSDIEWQWEIWTSHWQTLLTLHTFYILSQPIPIAPCVETRCKWIQLQSKSHQSIKWISKKFFDHGLAEHKYNLFCWNISLRWQQSKKINVVKSHGFISDCFGKQRPENICIALNDLVLWREREKCITG